jgi:hypothetical protein
MQALRANAGECRRRANLRSTRNVPDAQLRRESAEVVVFAHFTRYVGEGLGFYLINNET